MSLAVVCLLAIVQGIAELLPISSSAHVILVEKWLALDPSSPEMTFLLVMLHTGTMLSVLVYFFPSWKRLLSKENPLGPTFFKMVFVGTLTTGLLGLALKHFIETQLLQNHPHAEVELLFGNLWLIGTALAIVGLLILLSGLITRHRKHNVDPSLSASAHSLRNSVLIGLIQGLSLPCRGFSRSGSTISLGLLLGLPRGFAEEYSFALAVAITPFALGREIFRLHQAATATTAIPYVSGVIGLLLSFLAGWIAIRWLSRWLEKDRWAVFGVYCLGLSALILGLAGTEILG